MDIVFKWITDNKDIVQALCALLAVLVGFLSIILTVLTLRNNRKHNRLSVKPILRIDRLVSTSKGVSVSLLNSGVGPAIIKSVKIKVDGIALPNYTLDTWDAALDKVLPKKYNVKIFSPSLGDSFSAGEEHALFAIPSSELVLVEYQTLMEAFQRITFEIFYASIYNETFKNDL